MFFHKAEHVASTNAIRLVKVLDILSHPFLLMKSLVKFIPIQSKP